MLSMASDIARRCDVNGILKLAGLAALIVLSACAPREPASRSPSSDPLTLASSGAPEGPRVLAPRYTVTEVQVSVPRTLRVSEANVFFPLADIVWRGDPVGDRHAQIAAIFRDAAAQATLSMKGPKPAVVQIEVARFHGVTEKTRYTVGGTHNMEFFLTVRDAATGAVLDGPRRIEADAHAAGGQAAIAEEMAGRTQKVVVTETLVRALRRELSAVVLDPVLVARALSAPGAVALR